MTTEEFRTSAHALVDWMAEYMNQVESYPVKAPVKPRDVIALLPDRPPAEAEPFGRIFDDFRNIIIPGMTHWQHPSFFAYFPANSSPPSVLAEMLTATLGAQCMSWVTSPAATELEERMMQWLRIMTGLPESFTGVLHDTASTATLCALLTARERRTQYLINQRGFAPDVRFTVYCSAEAHSSVEKAVKIAGIGSAFLRKIPVDDAFALLPRELDETIRLDVRRGYTPLAVVAAIGTTGSTAVDPLRPIAEICAGHSLWLHVDAAYAGSALVLPEFRWMIEGIERADSFVFNPHKWLFTNFDCSAYFVRDVEALVRTFEILPEYLKTSEAERVNNYRDWGIQLGRRFRALKLWFVIRTYGVRGLQDTIRGHLELARQLESRIRSTAGFELLAPAPLNTLCFRCHPARMNDPAELDSLNARLLESLNQSGTMFLSHTRLNGRFTIRMVIGQTNVGQHHVDQAWERIVATAQHLGGTS